MMTSKPRSAKNPLKRDCNECGATDRTLQRNSKKPKEAEKRNAMSEEKAAAIEETIKLKKSVADMSAEDRAAWYDNENKKRAEREKGSKRTFTDPKSFVNEYKGHENRDDEIDVWQTFEEFAKDAMLLKKCNTHEGALELWRN